MNLERIRHFCLSLKDVTEDFPFDKTTLVFRINRKIFALIDIDDSETVNVKCNPEKALELRASYPDHVLPGYHMNKKHWNTVVLDGYLTDYQIEEMLLDSYRLVLKNKC